MSPDTWVTYTAIVFAFGFVFGGMIVAVILGMGD